MKKRLPYFFECYFNQSYGYDELEKLIEEFKRDESFESKANLIVELHQIIQTKSYNFALNIIKKHGYRNPSLEKTEQLIKFIYDRFTDKSTKVTAEDFITKFKGVFCPICCPKPEAQATFFNLIHKATVIERNIPIYICRACKSMWTTEDIRADNAQDYKKFMKSLGLKGLWNELRDVDLL